MSLHGLTARIDVAARTVADLDRRLSYSLFPVHTAMCNLGRWMSRRLTRNRPVLHRHAGDII
jgi:hypothetical protein